MLFNFASGAIFAKRANDASLRARGRNRILEFRGRYKVGVFVVSPSLPSVSPRYEALVYGVVAIHYPFQERQDDSGVSRRMY